MKKHHLILLIVLVLIVVVLLRITTSYFTLYNGDEWDNYRLGDVFRFDENDTHYNPEHNDNILFHTEKFPDSIASSYMKRNIPNNGGNLSLLKEIIKEKDDTLLHEVSDDTLVLHMRVGDIFGTHSHVENAPHFYGKKGDVEWWNSVIDFIKNNNIKSVIILSGAHINKYLEESSDYIKDRSQFLKDGTGVSIDYRIGQPPDDDVIYCSKAKHVMTTGGGFGNLLTLVSQK